MTANPTTRPTSDPDTTREQPGLPTHNRRPGVADAIVQVLDGPLRVLGYDGSAAGPVDAPVELIINDKRAIAYMVRAPGELGFARAYVSGAMDVRTPGIEPTDHYRGLRALSDDKVASLTWRQRLRVLRALGPAALSKAPVPPQEVGAHRYFDGMRAHLPGRAAAAIAHHYDVSNRFYEWVLGPSMAYTCAVYPHADASLEEAQSEKFDLVCRKLDLQPGMRLLDIGCGWGGMVMHAVREYGVTALGVTLSKEQTAWGNARLESLGLTGDAEIRHADYRTVTETGFDAISSIGITEHIGIRQIPSYAAQLAATLRPGGRLLNHCITRADEETKAIEKRGFIARYVFPDGELPGIGRLAREFQRVGLEVRHEENLREHYAMTCAAWNDNLDAHWDEAVAEVGQATARVWAAYLAGSRISFEDNQIQLHQILTVKPEADGTSHMPLRPTWVS